MTLIRNSRHLFYFSCAVALAFLPMRTVVADASEFSEMPEEVFDPFYVGASGYALLPSGGMGVRVTPAVEAQGGYYLTERLAAEGAFSWAPNAGGAHLFGLAARALWHINPYERFDPFATLGARGYLGHKPIFAGNRHRSACGPEAGLGFYYHLTEQLSFRAEARAMLVCDAPCAMLYSVGAGLTWSFGGGSE